MQPALRARWHRLDWLIALVGCVAIWGVVGMLGLPGRVRPSLGLPPAVGGPPIEPVEAATLDDSPPWLATCDWRPRYAPPPVIAVDVKSPIVVGDGLAPAVIRRHVRRTLDKIGACYQRQLRLQPELAGEVQLAFAIAPNGHVAIDRGTVEGERGALAEVGTCIAGVVGGIVFPMPAGARSIEVYQAIDVGLSTR